MFSLVNLLYFAAAVLVILGVLVLVKVIALGAGWVALFIAAAVCVLLAHFVVGPRHGPGPYNRL